LLLGTLEEDEEHQLGKNLNDPTVDNILRIKALSKLQKYFDHNNPDIDQSNPDSRLFDHKNPSDPNSDPKYGKISLRCPVWSHVRKANPRMEDALRLGDNKKDYHQKHIFRRGYPYMENGPNGKVHTGLLFVCFRKDLEGFEDIKKNLLNNIKFPVPARRGFTYLEIAERHSKGRFTADELDRMTGSDKDILGLNDEHLFDEAKEAAKDENTNYTGREGLAGPSKLGVIPTGNFLATVTLGGGYYFIPPIPEKKISMIGDQLFHRSVPRK
jgi:Dyp-type peroxidase, C-terminal